MPRVLKVGLASTAALLMFMGACEEKGGSSGSAAGPAPGQVTASEMPERDPATGENPEVDVYLPDARALGIEGWQDADQRLGRGDQATVEEKYPLSRSEGQLRAIAEASNQNGSELSVIPGEDGTPHLGGLADPKDTAALMGIFGSAEVKTYAMSSVPPNGSILSLGEMAAAAIQLVGVEPSAESLVGPDADAAVAARLERAARAWPEDARVWRVIGLPPDGQEELSIRFGPDNDPDDDRDEARHRQLQSMGILEFAPIEGGGPGDLISTSVTFDYQDSGQTDRLLSIRFLYDSGTDRWILRSISSTPSPATMRRMMDTRQFEALNSMAHSIDMLELLPECHLVVGEGGPLLCK